MRSRSFVAAAAFVVSLLALPSLAAAQGHYQEFGDARGFLNILPPGQDGSLNGPEAIQAQAGHIPAVRPRSARHVRGARLRVARPRRSRHLRLLQGRVLRGEGHRHPANVLADRRCHGGARRELRRAHIFGETRYATMFAQGYTAAEDRLFLMDVLRHYGRSRVSEFIGASPSDVAMDREQLAIAPYKEADLTAQVRGASRTATRRTKRSMRTRRRTSTA